jgi:hypothetical protein
MSGNDKAPQQLNALMPHVLPPAPLDQEIRRLIAVHGAEAVKREVKAATRPRRGRKQEKDGPLLHPFLEQDARDWLEGRDPFALRSQKSIARQVATENPGHSFDSTMRRLERKLASNRRRFMLYAALDISRREYPFAAYLRTVEELATVSDLWRRTRELEGQILARYVEVYGEPDPAMTWQDLEAKPRYPNALEALLGKPKPSGGMFGNLSRAKG